MNKRDYQNLLKSTAESIAHLESQAQIHFAKMLRLMDEEVRISRELGIEPQYAQARDYFDCVYRLLCFGVANDRFTLMFGTSAEIDELVQRVQSRGGFSDENGFFIEV